MDFSKITINNETHTIKDATARASIATLQTSVGESGHKITLVLDNSTFILTAKLLDANDNELSSQQVDLPLETMVVGATYSETTKEIVLTLKNGESVAVSVADLVDGLVSESALAAKGYITESAVDKKLDNYVTEAELTAKGYATQATVTANYNELNSNTMNLQERVSSVESDLGALAITAKVENETLTIALG